MSTYERAEGELEPPLAAIFTDRESAHAALEALYRAGFRRFWRGQTPDTPPAGEPTIEAETAGGFMEALGRFVRGDESRDQALHDALITHGLDELQARRIEAAIAPGNAVVLVDGEYDPALALRILSGGGGRLESRTPAANSPSLGDR